MSRDDQPLLSPYPPLERRAVFSSAMADAVPILIGYVDREERYRFVNRAYELWFGIDRSQIEGRTLKEVMGDEAYGRLRHHVASALAGRAVTFEGSFDYQSHGERYIEAQYVPDIARGGEIPGYYVLVTDISERKRQAAELERMLIGERRRTALLDLGQKLRDEADPLRIAEMAARMLTEQLGVARAGYAEMDEGSDVANVVADDGRRNEVGADTGVAPLKGQQFRLDDFGPSMSADMRAGRLVSVGDVALDPRTNSPEALDAYEAIGIRAFLTVSLIKAGELSAYLFLAHDGPHAFTADETAFVADVAELIWTASERARSDLALKRAEETERLLIREVDHRAKNVLAVVQSLAQLTPFEDKAQYVQALSGRIGSLARAHSLLSTTRWSGVDLHDLLRLELDPYGSDGGQVVIDGPPALIDAQAAQSLALVIHELATNASKYGALSRPLGRLNVSWIWGAEDVLHLIWREDAGAPVVPPARRGFGSTLIESAVKQVGGRIEQTWRPQGLKVRLDILKGAQARAAESTPAYRPGLGVEESPALRDQRVLVVEDEAVVAMELTRVLTAAGAKVVGPVGTIEEALILLDDQPIDRALLDVNLGGRLITPVANALTDRRIPFVYLTGYQEPDVDDGPILRKPVATSALLGALARGAPMVA